MFKTDVWLNGIVRKHLLEDAKAVAVYTVYPPEPDIGIMNTYVELEWLESISGRMLGSITRQMTEDMYNNIIDQINDNRMME